MPKINIYVPDDLHRQICRAEGVNWSHVAQRAFECEIARTTRIDNVKRETLMAQCNIWLRGLLRWEGKNAA